MCHLSLLDLGTRGVIPDSQGIRRGSSTREARKVSREWKGKLHHTEIFISPLEILALFSLNSRTKTSGQRLQQKQN